MNDKLKQENTEAIIQCRGLKKTFTDAGNAIDVLKGLDFTINAGEQVAIVGSSGSGKSTLLHCLAGLDSINAGEVCVFGEDIHRLSEKKRCALRNQHLGFIYQFHHLLPEFSAIENVAMPLLLDACPIKESLDKAQQILQQVGLGERLEHRLAELSGGERQRVAIARAIVHHPQCVLADEPTGNLDDKTSDAVYDLLLELNQQFNTTFIVVTHDMHLANKMDRVLSLEDGVISEST